MKEYTVHGKNTADIGRVQVHASMTTHEITVIYSALHTYPSPYRYPRRACNVCFIPIKELERRTQKEEVKLTEVL